MAKQSPKDTTCSSSSVHLLSQQQSEIPQRSGESSSKSHQDRGSDVCLPITRSLVIRNAADSFSSSQLSDARATNDKLLVVENALLARSRHSLHDKIT
jgi:hypothetical protein